MSEPKKEESFWSKLGKWFTDATLLGGEPSNVAVRTASGFERDNKGNWTQDPYTPGATQLRDNLGVLSAAAYTPLAFGAVSAPVALTPQTVMGGVGQLPWWQTVIGTAAGSMATGIAADEVSKVTTGKTIGGNIREGVLSITPESYKPLLSAIPEGVWDLANPLYLVNPSKITNIGKQIQKIPESIHKSINVIDYHHPSRRNYYFDGPIGNSWDNFDKKLFAQDVMSGKQDFIDWITSPQYREAALANKAEAEAMGLSYTPIWEKPSYEKAISNFRPKISIEQHGAQGWITNSDPPGQINLYGPNKLSLRPVVKHELAHSSRLAWADPELLKINPKYRPRQEKEYLQFKNSEVFDADADFTEFGSEFYDFTKDGFPHEAVTNTRDLGEALGIKVGEPYPGDEEVLRIINEVAEKYPYSFYGKMAKHFRRDNLQKVWKALNGTQWLLIPGLFGLGAISTQNN